VPGQWIELRFPTRRLLTEVEILWYHFFANDVTLFNWAAKDFDLQMWDGTQWVPVVRVRDNEAPEHSFTLGEPYLTDRVRVLLLASRLGDTAFRSVRLAEIDLAHRPFEPATAAPSFVDPVPDGIYEYTVTAINGLGFEGPPSDPAGLTVGTPIVLTAVADGANAVLEWTEAAAAAHYDVYRDGAKIAEVFDLVGRAYTDAGLANGTYDYFVRPVSAAGVSGTASNTEEVVIDVPPPPPPILISVTAPAIGKALDLVFEPGAGSTPAGYEVMRATAAGGPYESAGTTTETTFRDRDLVNGTTYFYVVLALDEQGNRSDPSNELSGTPDDTMGPDEPVLHFPGYPGLPYATHELRADLAGSSEPGAMVTVFADGSLLDIVQARSDDLLELSGVTTSSTGELSPDGRFAWHRDSPTDRIVDLDTNTDFEAGIPGLEARWTADSKTVFYVDEDWEEQIRAFHLDDLSDELITDVSTVLVAVPAPNPERLAVVASRFGSRGIWRYDIESDDWTYLVSRPSTYRRHCRRLQRGRDRGGESSLGRGAGLGPGREVGALYRRRHPGRDLALRRGNRAVGAAARRKPLSGGHEIQCRRARGDLSRQQWRSGGGPRYRESDPQTGLLLRRLSRRSPAGEERRSPVADRERACPSPTRRCFHCRQRLTRPGRQPVYRPGRGRPGQCGSRLRGDGGDSADGRPT
jgi:hypothetical protein